MQTIQNLNELDRKLTEADAALQVSDAAMRDVFKSFKMEYPTDVPDDPYSDEFQKYQFSLYERISGKSYQIKNEQTLFDVEAASARPFPFYTGSAETVKNHLVLVANLIGLLDLEPNAKILEFGPGWGNSTIFMAQLGFNVTAYDIEPNFVKLIQRRAERNGVSVDARHLGFLDIASSTEEYDAFVFFECFHHCSDHRKLIRLLKQRLKPNGKIIFGAEPISSDFPVPWGVRLDGEALWAIRKFGWLELGFNERYFYDLLRKEQLRAHKHISKDAPWVAYYVATHRNEMILDFTGNDQRILSSCGKHEARGLVATNGKGFFCYGPYINLDAGSYVAHMEVTIKHINSIGVDIAGGATASIIAAWPVPEVQRETMGEFVMSFPFKLELPIDNFELRIMADIGDGGLLILKSYRISEVLENMDGTSSTECHSFKPVCT